MLSGRGHLCKPTRLLHGATYALDAAIRPLLLALRPPHHLASYLTMVGAILGYQLSFETCRAYFEKRKPDVRRPIGPTPSYSILNDPEPEKFANSVTAVQVTGVIASDLNRKLGITEEYRWFRVRNTYPDESRPGCVRAVILSVVLIGESGLKEVTEEMREEALSWPAVQWRIQAAKKWLEIEEDPTWFLTHPEYHYEGVTYEDEQEGFGP
ncbi:hypothetical protein C8Q77DRAFT_1209139 [Trametes polyzona]|nr:hypothetical protein C8Q77DRAFT_1209139 [Trametes polyzona]